MSVLIRAATVYQKSGWWTNFVEDHRQAVLTANLDATINNVPVSQTVTGNAVELRKNDSMVDLGFSGALVDLLPNTFSGMTVNLQINKTAQDGLQNLISQISSLSTTQPPILTAAVTSQVTSITSFAKSITDFLFKSSLLVKKAETRNPFTGGAGVDPGLYVCFAADSDDQYQQYLLNPAQLNWNGAVLTFNGTPVSKVSYFIIEVGYQPTFFAKPLDALSFGASKPWVALYLAALREIPRINTAAQAKTTSDDVQSHLFDASTLLDQDYGFIDSERDSIASAVYNKINDAYHARLKAINLDPATAPQPPPPDSKVSNATVSEVSKDPIFRPNIITMDPAVLSDHSKLMQSIDPGKLMLPTTMLPK